MTEIDNNNLDNNNLKYNSYDVFDTLIGRLCYEPIIIFQIIEQKYNLNNFCSLRIQFEHETQNFDKIYKYLENIYKIPLIEVKKFEIFLEYELSIPIYEYLDKVNKNDILISDMYLPKITINSMINKHKKLNNLLYVSYGEKLNNIFWTNNPLSKNINIHYGDNKISDYNNPLQNNINAILVNNGLNNFERSIFHVNKHISYIIRAVRIGSNKYNYMTKLFNEYILPFSIYICFILKHKYPDTQIIFLSRDGYWFHKIYNILFNNESRYLYFSRKLVENSSNKLCETINNITGKKVLIDLQGSGNTYLQIKDKLIDTEYFLIYSVKEYSNYLFNLQNMINSNFPKYSLVEQLFSAPHGSAFKYNNNQIELLAPEYNITNLNAYSEGLKLFQNYFNKLNTYININNNYNYNNLYIITNFILYDTLTIDFNNINNYITHTSEHSQLNNIHPTNLSQNNLVFYSQINQDKYYIENIVNYKNNGFFFEAGGYDGVIGSNTLFLEKNLNWDGLIVECNPNLLNSIKKNRTCNICNKALYETSNDTIKLIVPTGEERHDGKEQLSFIETSSYENITKFKKEFTSKKEVTVNTINIMDLFKQYNITHIDFFSLDIEGYELNILNTINFDIINILFFTIEYANNETRKQNIIQFLESKNYKLNRVNEWDIEFIKK